MKKEEITITDAFEEAKMLKGTFFFFIIYFEFDFPMYEAEKTVKN